MGFSLQSFRHTQAHIHLDHLIENIRELKLNFGVQDNTTFFCPMVKANAYGHGDIEVALRLEKEGINTLGVGLIEEGLLLRNMGVKAELLVFGIFEADGAIEILHQRLTPVISAWSQLEYLESALKSVHDFKVPIDVHVKFDTGMHRLGFDWLEARRLFDFFTKKKNIFRVKGILTHLHSGDDAQSSSGSSYDQLKRFSEIETLFASFKPISHTLNSAGLLNFIQLKSKNSSNNSQLPGVSLNQGVRPGLSIYGYSPIKQEDVKLKPVMSLRSHIIKYHLLTQGEGVSYGHTWHAGRRAIVGVVPIGYADGYHRSLSNRGEVLLFGKRAPVVGNVCMDYITIDVTDIFQSMGMTELSAAQNMHAEVTLFGYDSVGNCLPATELAEKTNTIPWEILTSVGERVPRIQANAVTTYKNISEEQKEGY